MMVAVMVVGTTGTARDEQAGQIVHSATPGPRAWRQCPCQISDNLYPRPRPSVRGDSAARGRQRGQGRRSALATPPRIADPVRSSPRRSEAVRSPSPAPRVGHFRRFNGQVGHPSPLESRQMAADLPVWAALPSALPGGRISTARLLWPLLGRCGAPALDKQRLRMLQCKSTAPR